MTTGGIALLDHRLSLVNECESYAKRIPLWVEPCQSMCISQENMTLKEGDLVSLRGRSEDFSYTQDCCRAVLFLCLSLRDPKHRPIVQPGDLITLQHKLGEVFGNAILNLVNLNYTIQ